MINESNDLEENCSFGAWNNCWKHCCVYGFNALY